MGDYAAMDNELKKRLISRIVKESGWDRKAASAALAGVEGKPIPPEEYVRCCGWEWNEEELETYIRIRSELQERQKQEDDWCLDIACTKTRRSREKIKAEMEAFRLLGIEPYHYVKYGLYQPGAARKAKKQKAEEKRPEKTVLRKRNRYVDKICQVTGWPVSKVETEVARARLNCGSNYGDYYYFRMHELSPEQQRELATRALFKRLMLKFNGPKGRNVLNNKALFNYVFRAHIRRKWFVNRLLSYGGFLRRIRGVDRVIVKPLTATQGKGIQTFRCDVDDKRALYCEIMALPKSIVEEYIVQHDDLMAFCDTSVNTLRIVTLNANGKCNFLHAVLRMGRGNVVDNFHSGGIAAFVDVKTGVVASDAVDLEGNIYPVNPYSGVAMKGMQLPHWDKIIETCQKCYNKVPDAAFVGWDFAITPDGVDLIEGNPAPSYVVAQVPALQNQLGLRAVMFDPFL